MYTESIETEHSLLVDIIKSHDIDMNDGEKRIIRECPKCLNGTIITQCNIRVEYGNKCWCFKHYCDFCGEIFDVSRIRSDIFFHTPFEMQQSISTPFGDITVKVNGKTTAFRCRTDLYQSNNGKPILYKIIDIDVSGYRQNDIIECGFDHPMFDDFDGDENAEIAFCSNDTQILGLEAFAPDEYIRKHYCYLLEDSDYYRYGFRYRIIANPQAFDEKQNWQSKMITLTIGWAREEDYPEPDIELFLALT